MRLGGDANYFTLREAAAYLGIKRDVLRVRSMRAGVKPVRKRSRDGMGGLPEGLYRLRDLRTVAER